MVKYVPDRTGRFSQRPHYEPKELDRECENIIAGFLKERHGAAKYLVSTDDLTVLIERDTESLDQFADLSSYGCNVEGLTHFQPGRKPRVRISASLAGDENRQNRLRTTLAPSGPGPAEKQPECEHADLLSRQYSRRGPDRLDGVAGWLCLRRAPYAGQPGL